MPKKCWQRFNFHTCKNEPVEACVVGVNIPVTGNFGMVTETLVCSGKNDHND